MDLEGLNMHEPFRKWGFLTDKPMRLLANISAVDCVGLSVALPKKTIGITTRLVYGPA